MVGEKAGKKKRESVEKTKFWMRVLSNMKPKPKTLIEQLAGERIMDVMIVEKTGWSYQDIIDCPDDFYADMHQIFSMRKGIDELNDKVSKHKKGKK